MKSYERKSAFLMGTQYYRAPTPSSDNWAGDLRKMKELGFTDVKFWVQWRWSHRTESTFYFNDIDELMDLAQANGLGVTLNVIFDVAPIWLYEKYPDAMQVTSSGKVIKPYAVAHRQIGGHPGPCYNHPDVLAERKKFLTSVVEHFGKHPALKMWDVWNEPEQSFSTRTPRIDNLACYCDKCRSEFIDWLKNKYESIEQLNNIWGRCYSDWREIELPLSTETITDFVDWREFHLDTLTAEADWRLDMVKTLDPDKTAYLHVIPNTMQCFNSITCVDDFAISQNCDVFASTMNSDPATFVQMVSAGDGKVCYNVESHINFGSTSMHQRTLELKDVLSELLPQVGWGIKGFLFWQYKPECLGFESPAWGLVNPDGSDRSVTVAVREFVEKLKPHFNDLYEAKTQQPQVAIWKSRRNEIFHFCIDQKLDNLAQAVNSYVEACYWNNIPFRLINEKMLEDGRLDGIKVLIMPSPYYLSTDETNAIDKWVRGGGVLLTEAHLGGYNATTGRHSPKVPGVGLADSWGIVEEYSTSPRHLGFEEVDEINLNVTADTLKAIKQLGKIGSNFYPITLDDGKIIWAANRFAALSVENGQVLGKSVSGENCVVRKEVEKGEVWYCGGNISQGACKDKKAFADFLIRITGRADVTRTADIEGDDVHIDFLAYESMRFAVIINRSDSPKEIPIPSGKWKAIFSNVKWDSAVDRMAAILPKFADIFIMD